MIQYSDTTLFRAVNRFAGQWFLDSLADVEENLFLLKGGLFMAIYCWLWFEARSRRHDAQRRTVMAMLMASFAALFLTRMLAQILPFRVRPMYADPFYHAPSFAFAPNFENWSSFPSDTAALFISLALGVFVIWRAAGILLLVYTCLWICLPRLFLGLHYPTDLLGGALLGVASVLLFLHFSRTRTFCRWIGDPLLGLERRYPEIFYACTFPLLYEMAFLFGDVRYAMRHVGFLLRLPPAEAAMLWTFLAALAVLIATLCWKRARRENGHHPAVTELRRADHVGAPAIKTRFINARR